MHIGDAMSVELGRSLLHDLGSGYSVQRGSTIGYLVDSITYPFLMVN